MTRNSTLCQAIESMRVIAFTYEDKEGNVHHRRVEPYAHGETTAGNAALRGYQIGGTSESEIPGWKLFIVERMAGLRITEGTFAGSAPGYAHGDRHLNPLYCQVP